jgi:hypothetical protein
MEKIKLIWKLVQGSTKNILLQYSIAIFLALLTLLSASGIIIEIIWRFIL